MKYLFVLSVLFSPLFSYARCDYPDDLDSAGRRCGKRAASVRPGGRLGGDGSYNKHSEKTSNIIEKPQWTQRRQAKRKKRNISSIGGGMGIEQDQRLQSVLDIFKQNKNQWFTVKDIRDKLNKNWPVAGFLDHLNKRGELIKDPDGKGFKYCRFLIVFQ